MRIALSSAAVALLFASTAISQVMIPPHATVYNGYSRGFSTVAQADFFINQLELPIDAQQTGDTASFLVQVNGVQVLHSIGNVGPAITVAPPIQVVTGDLVHVVGNWSPAVPGNFTAHNSYGSSAPYATTIVGVPHTLDRAGWQWDIGDPAFGGTGFTGLTGSIGRVLMYVNPPTGLFAGFTSDVQTGASPLTVNFTDASFSSDPGGVIGWAWDFENDGTIDSTVQNPTHIYTACGSYDVSLTVFDAAHPANTLVQTSFITTDSVTASFTEQVIGPLVVAFTDTSTGPATTWDWDLDGDGITDSTSQNPAWVYPNANPVAVTLTVTRLCSAPSTIVRTIVPVQQITTTFVGGNGGGTGWVQLFDVTVTNPKGITLESLDINPNTVAAFTLDVYLCAGGYVGNEMSPEAWSLVGSTAGNVVAVQTPVNTQFPSSVYMPPGVYGICIQYNGISFAYTNGNGTNQQYLNGDVTLDLGISRATSVGAPFGAGGTFSPRVWNGTIYYSTAQIGGGAGYGFFGAGCAGSLGQSTLTPNANPVLGTTLTVDVDNLPLSLAVLMTGFSNTNSALGPLPVAGGGFGAPGCNLRVSPDFNLFVAGAGNTASWSLTIPNDPALGGVLYFQQAVALDPGFNPAGASLSNSAGMLLGN